ncbi:MAG: divalent-cation tolerance protein CutA [Deltaproteobacteria bacterium]|nr:MAG: divalent-cation tolerance protein CutA [Deltaproteobacteria bacterium]
MTEYIVIFVTAPEDEAPELARTLVDERLVACVNIVPGLRSIYWWQGQVEDEPEVLCIMKTRSHLFEALRDRVRELHSYEVEEIIALPMLAGNPPYLDWIKENTQR